MVGLLRSLFRRPRYRCYLFLGDSAIASYWDCGSWTNHLFPALGPLVEGSGCTPSVHCRQVTGPSSKEVKLGRLTWSLEIAQKWCHGPQMSERDAWLFIDLQVFCPPKQQLIEEDDLPTIYLQVKPMGTKDQERKTAYDQAVLIAMNQRFALQNQALVDSVIANVMQVPSFVALFESTSTLLALNQFESFIRETFIYRGIHKDEFPDVAKMAGKWRRAALSH